MVNDPLEAGGIEPLSHPPCDTKNADLQRKKVRIFVRPDATVWVLELQHPKLPAIEDFIQNQLLQPSLLNLLVSDCA